MKCNNHVVFTPRIVAILQRGARCNPYMLSFSFTEKIADQNIRIEISFENNPDQRIIRNG